MTRKQPEEPSLLKALVETTRAYEDQVLALHVGTSLRPAHLNVFRYLDPDGSRVGDLARAAGVTGQSMGELVGKVRELGYVDVQPDPADRRARLVTLTPAGAEAIEVYAGHVAAVQHRLERSLGRANVQMLRTLLGQATAVLDEHSD